MVIRVALNLKFYLYTSFNFYFIFKIFMNLSFNRFLLQKKLLSLHAHPKKYLLYDSNQKLSALNSIFVSTMPCFMSFSIICIIKVVFSYHWIWFRSFRLNLHRHCYKAANESPIFYN